MWSHIKSCQVTRHDSPRSIFLKSVAKKPVERSFQQNNVALSAGNCSIPNLWSKNPQDHGGYKRIIIDDSATLTKQMEQTIEDHVKEGQHILKRHEPQISTDHIRARNCKISFFFSSVICWSSLLCKLLETSTGALGGSGAQFNVAQCC